MSLSRDPQGGAEAPLYVRTFFAISHLRPLITGLYLRPHCPDPVPVSFLFWLAWYWLRLTINKSVHLSLPRPLWILFSGRREMDAKGKQV